jgi:hypothetical protein
MSDNKTNIDDLSGGASNTGELTEQEAASISGGQEESQRLLIIDTIHSNGTVTGDFK